LQGISVEVMDFETAAMKVKTLKVSPSNDELLELYGLYKQATVGDNISTKPWLDLKGRAKWDAWESRKNMTMEEAKKLYVQIVNKLIEKYGI
uniref:ACB domain-containing protein n=1 Tax=Parascaris univalens TaxID=6257 RepID=A0A915B086_PARUN